MNVEEQIKLLKSISVETGSLVCLGCGYEHNCGVRGCAILRGAVDKLEQLNNFSESQRAKLLVENAQLRDELEKVKLERDTLRHFFEDVGSKPDCNTCENKDCKYRPGLRQITRFNCPLWKGRMRRWND